MLYNNESPFMLIEKLQIQVEAPSSAKGVPAACFASFEQLWRHQNLTSILDSNLQRIISAQKDDHLTNHVDEKQAGTTREGYICSK